MDIQDGKEGAVPVPGWDGGDGGGDEEEYPEEG